MKTILKWLICCASIFLVNAIMPGELVNTGGIWTIIAAGTILWLVNIVLKPLAQILAIPFTIVTLGLFYFIVNALLVGLTLSLLPSISGTFWACLVVALFVSLLNTVLGATAETAK
ncbi:MAG: phage holin family protein [Eubacteriales bacterium]|nr:phage holin family protein [Eubacteriales bacterium]MDD4474746.1 phage holin family protein [Eubacteriales bacterium]